LGSVVSAAAAAAGQRNSVWLVTTSAGVDVVVRVLVDARRLAMERAVIALVAAAGVPVAEVLWATSAAEAVLVQRRLPGRMLSEVSPTDAVCRSVATTLRAIHGIGGTSGFGNLGADLAGEDDRLSTWFTARVRAEVDAATTLAAADRALLDRSLEVLDLAQPLLDRQGPGLVHGDVQPFNLLVDADDRVTGVLDWEAAKSGPPAFDLGWWDWFSVGWSTPWPTERMLEHYEPDDRDELDELRRLVVRRVWMRELVAAAAAVGGGGARAAAARRGLA
jgi:aminoglycoside phosphotransferase (APT) family kinase protein